MLRAHTLALGAHVLARHLHRAAHVARVRLRALRVALALAHVARRDPLAVPRGEALHLVAAAVDDDADGVAAALALPPDHLHGLRAAIGDGLRADRAAARLPQHLLRLLVEAADLALDLRRLRRRLLVAHGDLLLLLRSIRVLVAEPLLQQRSDLLGIFDAEAQDLGDLGDGFGVHLIPFR